LCDFYDKNNFDTLFRSVVWIISILDW